MFIKDRFGVDYIDADLIGRIKKFEDKTRPTPDRYIVTAYLKNEPKSGHQLLLHVSEEKADDLICRICKYKDRHDDTPKC